MFATAATTTQKRPMPRSSLCTYEFVVRIPTSTLQEHTCFKGNNGLNTSTNLPKSKKNDSDVTWIGATLCFKMLGALHTLLGIVKELEAFYRWASKPQLPLFTTGFLHRPPRWVGGGISEASTVSPVQKRWKNGGFCWQRRRFKSGQMFLIFHCYPLLVSYYSC